MGRSAKKKYSVRADLCGIYGTDIEQLRREDYELYVGLWLNRHRGLAKQSLAVRQGAFASIGLILGITPPKEWYVNVTESEDQAEFLHSMEQSQAMSAIQRSS